MTKLLSLGIFLSLILVVDMKLGDAPYAVLAVMVSALGLAQWWLHTQGQRTLVAVAVAVPGLDSLDRAACKALLWCWIPIVGSWIVGVVTGLIHGVLPANVFRNFFGLLSYLLAPVLLVVGPEARTLMATAVAAGFLQAFVALYLTTVNPPDPTLLLGAGSISDLRTIYSTGFVTMFPVLATGLALRWLPLARSDADGQSGLVRLTGSRGILALIVIALVVPAMSKGFVIATALIVGAMLLFSCRHALCFGGSWRPVVWAAAFGLLVYALLPSEVRALIGFSFSSDEAGNTIRSEQFAYLTSELTLVGNGLGATLRSGYSRDETGYGFELTYLNIIHKLGIWSVFLLGAYLLTVMLALRRLWIGVRNLEAAFALGSMGYLIVGVANPLLLSPTAVTLHCVAIFVLVRPYLAYQRHWAPRLPPRTDASRPA